MIKKIDDFKRAEIFKHYDESDNPFLYLTTKIDVTNIVNFCKTHKNFYATMGYIITKAVNDVDNFKYRINNGEFYYCDRIKSNYTQLINDEMIGFFDLPDITDYDEYVKEFKKRVKILIDTKENVITEGLDCIWISCAPWFQFSGIITPYRKEMPIPQFIWDKFVGENGKYTIHLMIMSHHGFVDGLHIGKLIDKINYYISNFNK